MAFCMYQLSLCMCVFIYVLIHPLQEGEYNTSLYLTMANVYEYYTGHFPLCVV
jgi:hypothetical protein